MESALNQLLEAITISRKKLLDVIKDISSSEGSKRLTRDGWSAQEVVEHLVLAERGGFDLICTAAEKFREGNPVWTGISPNEGLPIEAIIANTWKPKEIAPASATPTGKWSLGVWAAHLRNCDALLEDLRFILKDLPLTQVIYPHFLCGPLNSIQRLEFIRFHIDRHYLQLIEIKKKLKA